MLVKKTGDIESALFSVVKKLGILSFDQKGPTGKTYRTKDVPAVMRFSHRSVETIAKHLSSKTNRETLLKVLANLDDIITNAGLIEVRDDRYENWLDTGHKYDNVYTLISLFDLGTGNAAPVKIDVKQEANKKDGNIYFVLNYGDIEIGAFMPVDSFTKKANAGQAPKIGIASIASLVNAEDVDLLKYFPDGLLNSEQLAGKQTGLLNEDIADRPLPGEQGSASVRRFPQCSLSVPIAVRSCTVGTGAPRTRPATPAAVR